MSKPHPATVQALRFNKEICIRHFTLGESPDVIKSEILREFNIDLAISGIQSVIRINRADKSQDYQEAKITNLISFIQKHTSKETGHINIRV